MENNYNATAPIARKNNPVFKFSFLVIQLVLCSLILYYIIQNCKLDIMAFNKSF